MTLKKRRILLGIAVVVFAIAAPVINLYILGYRLTSDFKIVKTGGIYVYVPASGAKIYLNNQFKKESGLIQNGVFIQNLKPSEYLLLVAKDGFWPWQKKVKVREEAVSEIRPLLIPQNIEGSTLIKGLFSDIYGSPSEKLLVLTGASEKNSKIHKFSFYLPEENAFLIPKAAAAKNFSFQKLEKIKWIGNELFAVTEKSSVKISFDLNGRTYDIAPFAFAAQKEIFALPEDYKNFKSSAEPEFDYLTAKITTKKKEILWKDDGKNIIWFDQVETEKELPYFLFQEKKAKLPYRVFSSRFKIESLDFFPGRRDAAMAAINNGVYAIHLDGRGGRVIQPIYKGKAPRFAVLLGDKGIYVLDDGNLYYIELTS